MKTIHQLAKLSRRIPNRIRLWGQRKDKSKTSGQSRFCLDQIRICEGNARWLAGEIERRNINGPAVRDTFNRRTRTKGAK